MPIVLQLAHFAWLYPSLYRDDRYPTRDKVIPFKLFWLFRGAMLSVLALDRMNVTSAAYHAFGMAMEGDSSGVQKMTRRNENELFGEG